MQKFLNSKFGTVVLAVVLIFVMVITAKVLVQKRIVDREISKLQAQMDKIKKDNEQLSSLVSYLNTPEYKEKEAREKLNLAKEGEHVVVLPQGEVNGAGNTQVVTETKKDNYKLWVDYFFNAN